MARARVRASVRVRVRVKVRSIYPRNVLPPRRIALDVGPG
jgi:hypothetical protein